MSRIGLKFWFLVIANCLACDEQFDPESRPLRDRRAQSSRILGSVIWNFWILHHSTTPVFQHSNLAVGALTPIRWDAKWSILIRANSFAAQLVPLTGRCAVLEACNHPSQ